ncbi:MAG: type II toxin-antitoxin system RelE/ParE family toxin [Chloroflexi bacterium]|nr:type II toxin-antitoxin system RelE/ParE family toxin [Chloroflexota bacterium]
MYNLKFTPRADRDLTTLGERAPRHDVARLSEAIESLLNNPRPHGVRKVRGKREAYRVRVGNYRVIYEVDDGEHEVLISRVLRRNEGTYRA